VEARPDALGIAAPIGRERRQQLQVRRGRGLAEAERLAGPGKPVISSARASPLVRPVSWVRQPSRSW